MDPVRDRRVAQVLSKQGMEHCCVTPWSFGQEGKEKHKLKKSRGITTNSSGQLIVGDINEVKMFDPNGHFIQHFSLPNVDVEAEWVFCDLATDNKDNIYVLVIWVNIKTSKTSEQFVVYKFSNTAGLHHKFPVRGGRRLTVTNSKVLVLSRSSVILMDCLFVLLEKEH